MFGIDHGFFHHSIKSLTDRIEKLEKQHVPCSLCGKLAHFEDIKENMQYDFGWFRYYHEECYAKKFSMHKCENGCNTWLPNKEKK